ncbi:MAG: hypothetical protein JW795_05825, partial [Chitinivibrionales bacterium]|nr:hypothetical protein [Chitinivibrionales bacterium]
YTTGAGECVSLSTLYAASLFIMSGIPLESIYIMGTPLHSQNFIDIRDGVLTNNRRIVTKNMWFNGTEISAKARRALENEKVTAVVTNHGHIHILYKKATLPRAHYEHFSRTLRQFLTSTITYETVASFLRQNNCLQKCFQIAHPCCGKTRYIPSEKVFGYEHNSKSRIGDSTQESLMHEIDEDEYYTAPLPDRLMLNELEDFFRNNQLPVDDPATITQLKSTLHHSCYSVENVIHDLIKFCKTEPQLPGTDKEWVNSPAITLDNTESREQTIARIESLRGTSTVADLAFTCYRDMTRAPWKPFLKAALSRNPVCIVGSADLSLDQIHTKLQQMEDQSIYDSTRLAQPDEVWNFNRGDGFEKALCFMNILKHRNKESEIIFDADMPRIIIKEKNGPEYEFKTNKQIPPPKPQDFLF